MRGLRRHHGQSYVRWSQELIADFFPAYLAEHRARPHQPSHAARCRTSRRSAAARTTAACTWTPSRRSRWPDGASCGCSTTSIRPAPGASGRSPTAAFEDFAERFRHRARRLLPGEARLLESLSLTKCRRTDYDQIMLGMHDAAKRDRSYQATAPRALRLVPGRCDLARLHRPDPARGGQRPVRAGADLLRAGRDAGRAGRLAAAHPRAPLGRAAGLSPA